jgi:hypothetical protein
VFRPRATGKGKTGRVNVSEPLLMPHHVRASQAGCGSGVQGLAVEKRQVPVGQRTADREDTTVPGVKRAPNPVVSHTCGTWKPRQGPGCVPVG